MRAAIDHATTLGRLAALVGTGRVGRRAFPLACKIRSSTNATPTPRHRLTINQNVGRLWPRQAQVMRQKPRTAIRIPELFLVAILNTTLPTSSRVNSDNPCPFCSGATARKLPAQGPAGAGGPQVGTGAPSKTPRPAEPHLSCSGCAKEFVPDEEDIVIIVSCLQVETSRIMSCYGDGVTADGLLVEQHTGMAKKIRGHHPHALIFLARGDLIVCFRYNNVRTYGSFIREGSKPNGPHHAFREMGES